jgi:hypothetical protein
MKMETALLVFVWLYAGAMINFMYAMVPMHPIKTKNKFLVGLLFSVFGILNILIIPICNGIHFEHRKKG